MSPITYFPLSLAHYLAMLLLVKITVFTVYFDHPKHYSFGFSRAYFKCSVWLHCAEVYKQHTRRQGSARPDVSMESRSVAEVSPYSPQSGVTHVASGCHQEHVDRCQVLLHLAMVDTQPE